MVVQIGYTTNMSRYIKYKMFTSLDFLLLYKKQSNKHHFNKKYKKFC